MIICLLGYTCSGKSTLAKEIVNNTDIKLAVSYTTRPMRTGEIDGIDYNYVNDEFFINDTDNFIETREYTVADGSVWHYGYHKNSFKFDNVDYVCVITPGGYYKLQELYGSSNVIPILLETPIEEINNRLVKRGDSPQEARRRILDDVIQFDDFIKSEIYFALNNDGNLERTMSAGLELVNKLRKIYQ